MIQPSLNYLYRSRILTQHYHLQFPIPHQVRYYSITNIKNILNHEIKNSAALPECHNIQQNNIDYIPQTYSTSPSSINDQHVPSSINPPLVPSFLLPIPSSSTVTDHHPTLERPSIITTVIHRRNLHCTRAVITKLSFLKFTRPN